MDLEHSPAWAALPGSTKRVLAAIEATIADSHNGGAAISYNGFDENHGIPRAAIARSLRLLELLGLLNVEVGPRRISYFTRSTKWKTLDAEQVARLARAARQPRPPRLSSRPPKPAKPQRPVIEEPTPPQYKVPGLARLRFMGEI